VRSEDELSALVVRLGILEEADELGDQRGMKARVEFIDERHCPVF
jgi:hypothetical protein